MVDPILDARGTWLAGHLPDFLLRRTWEVALWQWIGLVLAVLLSALLGRLIEKAIIFLAMRAARLTRSSWDDQAVTAAHGPLRYPLFAALLAGASRLLSLPPAVQGPIDAIIRSVSVVALAWFALRFLALGSAFLEQRVAGDEKDPGRARGVRTQLAVLRRVFEIVIYLVAGAALLLQFDSVRNVGVSLLASAGIAGLVLGLAAQRSISTLFAGIQLSLTQPVRIGDAVVVEKEYGWVEEITLTLVVVRIWDQRRLVVPVAYFLEKPFQNWSRVSAELLGTVEVHADYRTDVNAVRSELERLLADEGKVLWDGRAKAVQVTEATDRSITLRALVSAADGGKLWDLRCLVREKLVAFLTRTPGELPTVRAETLNHWPEGPAAGPPTRG
ncbi:MAG: mechanosensitive ion channel family protein [Myxococcaceae bacterium]